MLFPKTISNASFHQVSEIFKLINKQLKLKCMIQTVFIGKSKNKKVESSEIPTDLISWRKVEIFKTVIWKTASQFKQITKTSRRVLYYSQLNRLKGPDQQSRTT